MKIKIRSMVLSVLALGSICFSSTAVAQSTIQWGAGAQNITDDNDIFTGGTLVDAFSLGSSGVPSTTVNGVFFQAAAFPANNSLNSFTFGNYSFVEDSGTLVSYNNLGTSTNPFLGLSPGYQTLLSSAGGSDLGDTLTLTISGLTIGQDYAFQFFTSNSAQVTAPNSGAGLSTIGTAVNSIGLVDNMSGLNGGLGQFAVGTFTATAVSQTIDFTGNTGSNVPTIDAFQLRVVPEPSTTAMMVMGFGGLIALMRQRRRLS